MPFVHHQTFIGDILTPPLQTNWGTASTLNSSFQVGWNNPPLSPQVGTRILYQSPSQDVPNSYVKYTNNIAGTWDQYTIEGWIVALSKNSWAASSSTREWSIGVGTNRIVIQFIPNDATSQFLLSSVYYDGTGNQQLVGSSLLSMGTWIYFALVKQNNNSRYLFINGSQVAIQTLYRDEQPGTTSGTALRFGSEANVNTTMPMLYDQVRISNVARYLPGDTFTPPTTAFTNDVNTWFLTSWENTYVPAPSPT